MSLVGVSLLELGLNHVEYEGRGTSVPLTYLVNPSSWVFAVLHFLHTWFPALVAHQHLDSNLNVRHLSDGFNCPLLVIGGIKKFSHRSEGHWRFLHIDLWLNFSEHLFLNVRLHNDSLE